MSTPHSVIHARSYIDEVEKKPDDSKDAKKKGVVSFRSFIVNTSILRCFPVIDAQLYTTPMRKTICDNSQIGFIDTFLNGLRFTESHRGYGGSTVSPRLNFFCVREMHLQASTFA